MNTIIMVTNTAKPKLASEAPAFSLELHWSVVRPKGQKNVPATLPAPSTVYPRADRPTNTATIITSIAKCFGSKGFPSIVHKWVVFLPFAPDRGAIRSSGNLGDHNCLETRQVREIRKVSNSLSSLVQTLWSVGRRYDHWSTWTERVVSSKSVERQFEL